MPGVVSYIVMAANDVHIEALKQALLPFASGRGDHQWTSALWNSEFAPFSTVYILRNAGDEIVYVGQTMNLRQRMFQHSKNPKICRLAPAKVEFIEPAVLCQAHRLAIETALIACIVPLGNRAIMLVINGARQLVEIRWNQRQSKNGRDYGLIVRGQKI